MEKKWKKTVIQGIICVGLVVLIWTGYFVVMTKLNQRVKLQADDFSWVHQVDSVEQKGKNVVLTGFAFKLDMDAPKGSFEIVLRDIESEELYFPKMKYSNRKDVNEYFLCEYDYLNSGYEATIKARELNLDKRDYEVLLKMKDEKKTYQTGTFISKGQLMYANPKKYVPLEVTGTDLMPIVENGVLRVYRPDFGIYVYQYEGELYWIAENDYEFDENGDTVIQYQLDTTQIEKLPQIRFENKWYWDNMSFRFSGNELFGWETGDYRVAKKKLPTAYAIEKIWTGKYVNDWVWTQDFRPWYQFK